MARLRGCAFTSLLLALPFLLFALVRLVTMDGFAVDPQSGAVSMVAGGMGASADVHPCLPFRRANAQGDHPRTRRRLKSYNLFF